MSKTHESSQTNSSQEQDLEVMREWKGPPFLRLAWHQNFHYRAREALSGKRSFLVVGPQGTGKTFGVRRVLDELTGQASGSLLVEPTNPILYYSASQTRGAKTGLVDLLEKARGGIPVEISEVRKYSASGFLNLILAELESEKVRLVCIDEAHLIDQNNLDLVRQVPDRGDELGHPVRLCLVGTETLRTNLQAIKQQGQRFMRQVDVRPLTLSELREHVTGFHPLLEKLKKAESTKDWKRLEKLIHDRSHGKMRRICEIIEGANAVALECGEPLSIKHLEASANDLLPE